MRRGCRREDGAGLCLLGEGEHGDVFRSMRAPRRSPQGPAQGPRGPALRAESPTTLLSPLKAPYDVAASGVRRPF